MELLDFNLTGREFPMTDDRLPLAEFAAKSGFGGEPLYNQAAQRLKEFVMFLRIFAAFWVASFSLVLPAQAQTEDARRQLLLSRLGLDYAAVQPPVPIFQGTGEYFYNASHLARPLLEGKGKRPQITDWVRQIYGYRISPELVVRFDLSGDEPELSADARQAVANFVAQDFVHLAWTRRDDLPEGSLTLYIGISSELNQRTVQDQISRACSKRACAIIELEDLETESVTQVIGWVNKIAAEFDRRAQLPRPSEFFMGPDGRDWLRHTDWYGNIYAFEFAESVLLSEGVYARENFCGLIIDATREGGLSDLSYRCWIKVGAASAP